MVRLPFTEPVSERVERIDQEVQVGEDLKFQQAWWRFERALWAFFVLLLALDLAGVFGRGPAAGAHARSADGSLDLHYERIERSGTPSVMTFSLGAGSVRDGVAHLYVSDSIVDSLGARRIIPQPQSSNLESGGLVYDFPVKATPARVRIELSPSAAGLHPFVVGVPGRAPVRGRVFVVP
jgi:hypothetical protein